jgi:hypothetical protein
MCAYHLDRRGFTHEGWLTENPDECVRCVTGFYPDWEMSSDDVDDVALESHIARLLTEQNMSH